MPICPFDDPANRKLQSHSRGSYWLTLIFAGSSLANMDPTLLLIGGETIGRPKQCWSQVNQFIQWRKRQEQTANHIQASIRVLNKFLKFADEKTAEEVTLLDVEAFLSQWKPGKNRCFYRSHISTFLKRHKNYCVDEKRWADPKDLRPHAKWLNLDEVRNILITDFNPVEEFVVRLALDMALRRCEIQRLQLDDIDRRRELIDIRGKWHVLRSVPFSDDFPKILERYLHYRDALKKKHKRLIEPPQVIMTYYRGHLKGCSETYLDDRREDACVKVGFQFGYQELRRTWARQAYDAGADLKDIQDILGHKDITTTIMYIGVRIDRGRNVMRKLQDYRQETSTGGEV